MALVVTPDLNTISLCESTTGWTGGGVTDPVMKIQGSNCLADQVKATTSALHYITGTWDATNKLIYIWMVCNGLTDTKANGGFRIYLYDGTNAGYWYVGGGIGDLGWNCYVIDPSTTPTTGSAVDESALTRVGVQFKTLTSVVGQSDNCYWDAMRYGTGLTLTSGASDGVTLEDVYLDDTSSTNAYGVVGKEAGVYTIRGKVIAGDGAGTGSIDFADELQTVIFPENEFVGGTYYGIDIVGNGTGTTNFQLGTKSGTAGISGCVIKANGSNKAYIDASDTDIDVFKMYGTAIINGGDIAFPPDATGREVLNCSFEACGPVEVDTCVVEKCNFIDATSAGALIGSTSFKMTDCVFIGCPDGIDITAVGTYIFYDLTFSGCTYDVDNSSGSAITVTKSGTSDPSTYEGSLVTYQASITITLTVQDIDTDPIENAQMAIYKLSDRTQLMNEDTTALGVATEVYVGTTPVDVEILGRKGSSGATKYKNFSTLATLSGDFELLITMFIDPYNNATT